MKNKNKKDIMQYTDEEFIEEAEPKKESSWNFAKKLKTSLIAAACITLFAVCATPLLERNPILYYGDDYYHIIKQLAVTKQEHKDEEKNNSKFDGVAPQAPSSGSSTADTQFGPVAGLNGSAGSKDDVTDNQVSGVIEADLIKRTSTHAFYLNVSDKSITSYLIDQENSAKTGSVTIPFRYAEYSDIKGAYSVSGVKNMFITQDCKTLIIAASIFLNDKRHVELVTFDISNPADMKVKNDLVLSGNLSDLRLIDDRLITVNQTLLSPNLIQFDKKETYLPYAFYKKDEKIYTAPDKTLVINTQKASTFVSVNMLNANTLEIIDRTAYLTNNPYDPNVYVTKERMYLSCGYNNDTTIICTDISADKLTFRGKVFTEGTVTNQYSMDEYNGVLRVFTTKQYDNGSCALFCYDINNGFNEIASIKGFAPKNETVRSARFDKDNAYVCTAIEQTDPVFFFDLSDLNNITYTDTGTIPGFSFALRHFGDGLLLGIGFDKNNHLKIEMYKEEGNEVISIAKYDEIMRASSDYKSFYIDTENGLIGFGADKQIILSEGIFEDVKDLTVVKYVTCYTVLKFDGESFTEVISEESSDKNDYFYNYRGFYDDGYYYMFMENDFRFVKID